MNPEQFTQFLKSNEESTAKAIEKYVNGGIRDLQIQLEKHSEADLKYQEKIDDNIKWAVRLIIGAVLLGIIATIFK